MPSIHTKGTNQLDVLIKRSKIAIQVETSTICMARSGVRDRCHQDGKSPMGEPDEHMAAVQLTGLMRQSALETPWTVFNAVRPTKMDPVEQLVLICGPRGR